MTISFVGKAFDKKFLPEIQLVFQQLEKNGVEYCLQEGLGNFLIKNEIVPAETCLFKDELKPCDHVVTLGGDGTILEAVALIKDKNIPILGINAGRLGFMSTTPIENALGAVKCLIKKEYVLDPRNVVNIHTDDNLFGEVNWGLNEFAIQKRDTSSMLIIHAYVDDQFLNSYWADGLIISTPTGSTGYSLSCGGPIITPQNNNFVIAPVNPHNLNVRPLIVPDSSTIRLEVEGRSSRMLLSLDSRSITAPISTCLTLTKADFKINLVQFNDYNFFNTLRTKLSWGMDYRN